MRVGFSPCPNDTFIFYAWVKGLVGNQITPCLHDIQALNETSYPLCKYSVITAFHKEGEILPVGGALGFGVGPLLVGKNPLKKVAIPGKGTVAHLLFDLFCDPSLEKVFTTYDQIIPMIQKGLVDGGVIIHETRFVYQTMNLELLFDLGGLWEQKTGLPLPLGALVLQPGYEPQEIIQSLRLSIDYAKSNFEEAFPYIQSLSQEKDRSIIEKHIALYVNEESYKLSDLGKKAIVKLYELARQKGLLHEKASLRFCNAP